MSQEHDNLYKQLMSAAADDSAPSDNLRARTLKASLEALQSCASLSSDSDVDQDSNQLEVRLVPDVPSNSADGVQRRTHRIDDAPGRRATTRRLIMVLQNKRVRWGAIAAAVALVMLGGVSLWPHRSDPASDNGQWWLGPPAVWAAEINAALEQVTEKGISCHERIFRVTEDGQHRGGDTVIRYYHSRDSYRRDIYDLDFLREIQWYAPDGEDMIQTGVRYDLNSYSSVRHDGSFGNIDPVKRLRSRVHAAEENGRFIGTEDIEGRECVGFEIGPDGKDVLASRVWFDIETKLPLRTETDFRPSDDGDRVARIAKKTLVRDQYDYDLQLPDDFFTPKIPEGFVNAHPDELK